MSAESMIAEDTIARMGRHGDGVTERGRFVPLTLPGERVRFDADDARETLVDVITPSADRVTPPCPHFGTCGGCALQHWADAPYQAWKRAQVVDALAREGLEPEVSPLVPGMPHGRRKAVLTARPRPGGVELGFLARGSHDLLDIETCHVVTKPIARLLPILRALLARLRLRKEASVSVLDTGEAFDIAVEGARPPSDARALSIATEICRRARISRLTVEGEPLVSFAPPKLAVGEAEVVPAPGTFVQAVAAIEDAMGALVMEAVGSAKRITELHAGLGTFTLRLARQARVTAYESDEAAVEALRIALRGNIGIKPSTAQRRDLESAPLSPAELRKINALVLDPPRAGAAAQMPSLATSDIPRIAYVSCNPATFARDAAVLAGGGYRLAKVTPLDQFLWSPHIELVGAFVRRT